MRPFHTKQQQQQSWLISNPQTTDKRGVNAANRPAANSWRKHVGNGMRLVAPNPSRCWEVAAKGVGARCDASTVACRTVVDNILPIDPAEQMVSRFDPLRWHVRLTRARGIESRGSPTELLAINRCS